MTHVFLSYVAEDNAFVDIVEADLIDQRHPAWRDLRRQMHTEDTEFDVAVKDNIENALTDAYAVAVVMSKRSLMSETVQEEYRFAQDHNLPIILLDLDGVPKPKEINESALIDFSFLRKETGLEQLKHYRDAIHELVETLNQLRPTTLYLELLHHPNDEIRETAARRLGELGDPSATDELIEALRDNDADVRLAATEALGKIKNELAVKPLSRLVHEESDPDVLSAVATALGNIGRTETVGVLLDLVKNPDRFVRAASATALGKMRSQEAIRILVHMMRNDAISDVRDASTDALCLIYSDTRSPQAERALRRAKIDWQERLKALEA